MSTEFCKNGVVTSSIITRPMDLTINKNNIVVNPNLAKNTFGSVELGYTVPSSGGSEGGPQYAVTNIVGGQTYTVSAWLKGYANMNLYTLNSGGNVSFQWVNKSDMSTDYRFYTITFTMPTGRGTTNAIYVCTRYTTSPTPGDWFKVWPNTVKIELGSTATPWIPHVSDACYSELNFASYSGTTISNPIFCTDLIEN